MGNKKESRIKIFLKSIYTSGIAIFVLLGIHKLIKNLSQSKHQREVKKMHIKSIELNAQLDESQEQTQKMILAMSAANKELEIINRIKERNIEKQEQEIVNLQTEWARLEKSIKQPVSERKESISPKREKIALLTTLESNSTSSIQVESFKLKSKSKKNILREMEQLHEESSLILEEQAQLIIKVNEGLAITQDILFTERKLEVEKNSAIKNNRISMFRNDVMLSRIENKDTNDNSTQNSTIKVINGSVRKVKNLHLQQGAQILIDSNSSLSVNKGFYFLSGTLRDICFFQAATAHKKGESTALVNEFKQEGIENAKKLDQR